MKFELKIFSDLHVRKHFLIGILLVFVSLSALAQLNLQDIGKAIKQGDAKRLSAYFDKQIDLTFSDKSTTYSKRQAELIIQKFFSKVEPSNFVNALVGGSHSNNTKYIIANMVTSNGVYKVYMFFVQSGSGYVLRELRFEK